MAGARRALQSRMTVLEPPSESPSESRLAARAAGHFGRFELRALIGRSAQSMAWRAFDPRSGQELLLVLPRQQPASAAALSEAVADAQRAARLAHPQLVHAVEVGQAERWPYIAYDVPAGSTLAERRRPREGEAPESIAGWVAHVASGLAFAHDAGHAHHDLQPWLVTIADNGSARLLGLGAVCPSHAATPTADAQQRARRDARDAAERDVMALALLLHGLLAGTPAFDDADLGAALQRLAPRGSDNLRLPWDVPRAVPDALRAIANRATDRQVRQRYRSARTLARALEGWLDHDARSGQDAHAALIERVRELGVLPAMPGAAARAARLAMMEKHHTDELAQLVMQDAALTLELLRAVNSAQVRGTQVSGNGPVLTVRRAIAMVGLEGVRRSALAMRNWPGPLDDEGAADLRQAIGRAQRAARLAQALRPPGYDLEMTALVTLLQNLGRLVLHYHAADDMRQWRRLLMPISPSADGQPEQPGMSEQAAAFAVFGCDIEGVALAVARWMGLAGHDETVLHLLRRLPPDKPVRLPDSDDDVLRALASAANEAVDALALPAVRRDAAIERVAKRYARALDITPSDLMKSLQASERGELSASPPAARSAAATPHADSESRHGTTPH
jgi:eukaryotic-like serine/threonine-protein kinase